MLNPNTIVDLANKLIHNLDRIATALEKMNDTINNSELICTIEGGEDA